MGEMSEAIDQKTLWECDGRLLLARWKYVLDTSNDDDYPFISEGQLLLRSDGAVCQRVFHSADGKFGSWAEAPAAPVHDGPYTVRDVERMFGAPGGNYAIVRLAHPPGPRSPGELRAQLEERLAMMSAVCRELAREEAAGDLASQRSQAAYGRLLRWICETYGFRFGDGDFRYGLRDPAVYEVAPDLIEELGLYAEVCDDLSMVYSAGVGMEFERDMDHLRRSVERYVSHIGQ